MEAVVCCVCSLTHRRLPGTCCDTIANVNAHYNAFPALGIGEFIAFDSESACFDYCNTFTPQPWCQPQYACDTNPPPVANGTPATPPREPARRLQQGVPINIRQEVWACVSSTSDPSTCSTDNGGPYRPAYVAAVVATIKKSKPNVPQVCDGSKSGICAAENGQCCNITVFGCMNSELHRLAAQTCGSGTCGADAATYSTDCCQWFGPSIRPCN